MKGPDPKPSSPKLIETTARILEESRFFVVRAILLPLPPITEGNPEDR